MDGCSPWRLNPQPPPSPQVTPIPKFLGTEWHGKSASQIPSFGFDPSIIDRSIVIDWVPTSYTWFWRGGVDSNVTPLLCHDLPWGTGPRWEISVTFLRWLFRLDSWIRKEFVDQRSASNIVEFLLRCRWLLWNKLKPLWLRNIIISQFGTVLKSFALLYLTFNIWMTQLVDWRSTRSWLWFQSSPV